MNRWVHNTCENFQSLNNIYRFYKHTYSSAHKNMEEVTQKGCQMLVDSIDNMHKSNMIMEEKWYKIQELMSNPRHHLWKTIGIL